MGNRAALISYASSHKDANGALALLAVGAKDAKDDHRSEALRNLSAARERLPQLADFIEWLSATVAFDSHDFDATAKSCETILRQTPKSPLSGHAAILAARAYSDAEKPEKAVEVLRRYIDDLPQPEGDAALAGAYDAIHDTMNAVAYDQRAWLGYPMSPQAKGAEAELQKYRDALGASFPEPPASARLLRAAKLMDARQYDWAGRELKSISESASGLERELALVRIGEATRRSRKDSTALTYLQSLQVASPEADAERLYQLLAAARRANRVDEMESALDQLAGKYPKSEWRLQALVAAGNEYVLLNQPSNFEPVFRTCYTAFPRSGQASYCHWKVAFAAYLQDRKDAVDLLKSHVRTYPDSEKASAALYFLGRIAERTSNWSDVRAYYDQVLRSFPNHYYALLVREERTHPEVVNALPSRTVMEFLRLIHFPGRPLPATFAPLPASRARMDRASLLRTAALDEFAEMELRFGARTGEQPEAFGLELARIASERQAPERAIRYLKRYAPGYLYSPVNSAPKEFWTLAFPLPWREPLFQYSRQVGLDPYMVAALIRQESEFDPKAISSANAYGLTQILPSTGRELSRRMRIRGFNAKMLLRPEFNLRLGTAYLKSQLDSFEGQWEPTLAAYNAGGSRVSEWLKRAEYREPAEFVESIPFAETRNYVQAVLRNADLYRRLYHP